jgi:hypothetical protein
MSEKIRLLREADETFGELRRAIDGVAEPDMLLTWLGTWGVREILIHISGWHRAMIPALEHIARGEPPYPAGTYDDFDAWNARFVTEKAGVKISKVLAELEASHQALVKAAVTVPEGHFEQGGGVRDLFDGVTAGHYREHTAQIREWRQAAVR